MLNIRTDNRILFIRDQSDNNAKPSWERSCLFMCYVYVLFVCCFRQTVKAWPGQWSSDQVWLDTSGGSTEDKNPAAASFIPLLLHNWIVNWQSAPGPGHWAHWVMQHCNKFAIYSQHCYHSPISGRDLSLHLGIELSILDTAEVLAMNVMKCSM